MAKSIATVAARALRTAAGRDQSRKDLIRAVRAAARRKGLDDDDRRAIQRDVTGKQSLSDMTPAEIGRVLDHLNAGWKGPMGHRAHHAKIKALWWTLYWLSEVDDARGIDAFVRRQTGIGSLRFLDHSRAPSVIEALKAIAARAGVRWPGEADLAAYDRPGTAMTLPLLERHHVLSAIAAGLRERGAIDGDHVAYVRVALGLGLRHLDWTAHELDAAVKLLGRKLRRLIERERDAG